MKHRCHADLGAEALGIGSNGNHRLCRYLEQQVIDDGLILVRNVCDRGRQREYDVIIGHRQQFGFARRKPLLGHGGLTLRAMPIAAGVVGDVRMRERLATRNMTAEYGRSAALDRTHYLELAETDVTGIGSTPSGTMAAEYVRDLQYWTRHRRRRRLTAGLSPHLYQ